MLGAIDTCHVLEAASVPCWALASALSRLLPTTAWRPDFGLFAAMHPDRIELSWEGTLQSVLFPLQRGYTHPTVDRLLRVSSAVHRNIAAHTRNPARSLLVCTSPFWANVAEIWPGPVVYYSFDYTYAYDGFSPEEILQLETRLSSTAVRVFCVSARIRDYLVTRAGCPAHKISVLPNATLSDNIQSAPAAERAPLPADIQDLPRPIAGVIGNMADNIDWVILNKAIEEAPDFSWVFVGPVPRLLSNPAQAQARQAILDRGKGVRFLGPRAYSSLQSYARAFDVAVLPYRMKEPTYSGSPTRYFEHLAAGRPMVATRNVAQLEQFEPLLRLVGDASGLAAELNLLRDIAFRDGFESARIRASRHETWDARARALMDTLSSPSTHDPTFQLETLHLDVGDRVTAPLRSR